MRSVSAIEFNYTLVFYLLVSHHKIRCIKKNLVIGAGTHLQLYFFYCFYLFYYNFKYNALKIYNYIF